jgi:hypothetical protein
MRKSIREFLATDLLEAMENRHDVQDIKILRKHCIVRNVQMLNSPFAISNSFPEPISINVSRNETLIVQPSCMHLVILTLSLAKGKNLQALRRLDGLGGFFALRAQNDKLVGALSRERHL